MPKVRQLFYGNFDTALKATETAYNSNGSAARENQKVLESLNGSIQKLKAEWESLANSKATQDTLKFFVDLTTNIIKLLKQIGGLRTAFIALATVMTIRNASKIIDTFTKLYNIISMIATKGLPKYIAQLHITTAAETAEATAATAAATATMAFQVALGVIAVAAIALIAIIGNLSSEYEKNAEAVNKAKEEYQAIVNDQQAVQDKIKDIEDQIIELNKNPIDITKQKTIDDLNEQKQLLQDQLDILDMLEKYKKSEIYQATYEKLTGMGGVSNKELMDAGVDLFSASDESRIYAYGKSYSTIGQKSGLGYHELNPVQRLEVLGDAIQDYTNKIKELEEAQGHLTGSEDEIEKQYNKNKELIEEYSNNTLPKLKGMYATLAEELEEDKDNLDENNAAHKSLIDTIVNVITGQRDFEQANKDSTESVKNNTEAIEENANTIDTINSKLDSVYSLVEEADKKYKDLSAAVEEYNDQGKLSISTLAKMMKDYPEYLDALNKEGWSIETVNNMLSANIKIKLEEAKIAAQAARERIQNAKTHLEEARAALLNAQANDTLANSHAKIAKAAHDAQHEERSATQEYNEQMRKIAELEAALAGGFGGYTKPKDTGKTSTKKETDKWKEAFEKAYNDLKHRRNIDLIDTEQYIKELTELNDQYFKDRVEYETEYNKYVEELYKERQNLFKEQINDLKFALEMLENQGANKQTLIAKYKEIQEKLHEQAEYYRSLEIEENNDLIQNLQSQWWDYQKKIKSLEEDIVDEIEKQNKEIKEQLEKEIELLDERFEALRDYAKDAIDAEIELKEKSLEAQNALLDEQINKYKEEKENLDDQKSIADKLLKIEEARKKLAESKNQKVRVYREGKGFVYESDFDAVAQAQNQLDELLKDWDLFQEKAKIADIIAELESEKEANEKRVNAEIEDLNRLKDAWDKSLDLSKDVEDYKGWLTKIKNSESASFNERLSLVKSFVASYNREMASLQTKYPTTDEVSQIVSKDSNKAAISTMKSYGGVLYSSDVDYQALINNTLANAPETEKASMLKNYETKRNAKIAAEGLNQQQTSLYGGTTFSTTASKSSSSGGGSSSRSSSSSSSSKSSSSSSSSTTMSKNDQTKIAIAKEAYNIAKSKGDTAGMAAAHATAEKVRASYGYSGGGDGSQNIGLASGTYDADGMMHLVGEEGPELFIPPEGSGIIPNPKTANLMQWGNINPAQLLSNMGGNTTIEVGNITLPNVTNAKSFVEELKNFRTYAVQRQSVRR